MTFPVFGYSQLDGRIHVISHAIKDKLVSMCEEELIPAKTKKQRAAKSCEYCNWLVFLNEDS